MGTPPSDCHTCHGWGSNNSCLKSCQIWPDKCRDAWDPLWLATSAKVVTWLLMNYHCFGSGAFSKVNTKRGDQVAFAARPRRRRCRCRALGLDAAAQRFPWPKAPAGELAKLGVQGALTSWCNSLFRNMAKGELEHVVHCFPHLCKYCWATAQ